MKTKKASVQTLSHTHTHIQASLYIKFMYLSGILSGQAGLVVPLLPGLKEQAQQKYNKTKYNPLIIRKMKKIILSMLVITAMVSCSKTETDGEYSKNEWVTIDFGGSVEAITKAASAFTNAYVGTVGVAANPGDAWVTAPADYTNVGLKIASSGALTTTPTIYLPSATYNFYSVATNHTVLPTRGTDTYPLAFGLVSENATTGGDIIYAATQNQTISKTAKAVALKYNHVYGKVKFVVTGATGQFTTAEIAGATINVLGFIPTGTLAVKTGAISENTTYTGAVTQRDVEYYALPQTMSATNDLAVTVTIGNEAYTGTIKDANGDIVANQNKTITITASRAGLTFTGTLEDWTSDTGAGTVQ